MIRLARRMSRLGTESAFEVLARAKALEAQGREIIHLEIGEPDFDTPSHIIEAACDALRKGATHYTPSAGIMELRQTIAEHMGRARNQTIDPRQVVVTPGAKPIMFFTIIALAQQGDEVIYPNPGFPIYESMIRFVGARPVPIPLREERDFRFDVNELRDLVTDRTRLIILNSPQNPTGGVLEPEDLKAIAEICTQRNIPVLADEVYEHILYDGQFASITTYPGMSMSELSIMLHGFSKTYAMTGWRLGFGIMPIPLAEQITRLMTNSNSCTSASNQFAGIAALKGPQDSVAKMVKAFRERRDIIVDGLNEIPGIRCVKPKGAFYVFPNIKGTGMDSRTCEAFIMDKAGVACLSGAAFGQYGEGYLRLSYANSVENIRKALNNIKKALAERK